MNAVNPFFRLKHSRLLAALVLLLPLAGKAAGPQSPARVQLTILATTDLHGNVLPVDYYTNQPDQRGLAKVSTIIKQARKENPDLILIDSGDIIQGTPLEYVHNKKNNSPPDPMMKIMTALGYDAVAVGNHEYNFGLKVLEKARSEAGFPWLSANTYETGTDRPHYTPYIVKTINGVRVGILGLTTPGVPNWDNVQNYAGLEFRVPTDEAKKWVKVLRDRELADVVVVAMHMGLETDLKSGEMTPGQVPNENQAIKIAKEVPGIDAIFMGHTHRDVPSLFINGVLLAQANLWGRHIARADIYLEKDAAGSHWRVAAKSSRTIPVTDQTEVDPEIVKLAEPYNEETQRWLNGTIGESDQELTAGGAEFQDSAILDLVQRVQLEKGQADVSMVANFNRAARIAKGPVTVRDIAGLYIYENTLVVLEVTGQQLKDALEHSARYFRPFEPNKSASDLIDERIPGYNYDMAEGVSYDLDLTKPYGQRIQNLRYRDRPLRMDEKLKLATNNYRVNGGGGYNMYKGAPVVYRSSQEIREMIIDWVEEHKRIPVQPTNNWRLLGAR
jgi:2',3'-cyclic-nucleotide 2'-phosphodiesterase / 3'-nucleotidase